MRGGGTRITAAMAAASASGSVLQTFGRAVVRGDAVRGRGGACHGVLLTGEPPQPLCLCPGSRRGVRRDGRPPGCRREPDKAPSLSAIGDSRGGSLLCGDAAAVEVRRSFASDG
jgi:hypothetical protein